MLPEMQKEPEMSYPGSWSLRCDYRFIPIFRQKKSSQTSMIFPLSAWLYLIFYSFPHNQSINLFRHCTDNVIVGRYAPYSGRNSHFSAFFHGINCGQILIRRAMRLCQKEKQISAREKMADGRHATSKEKMKPENLSTLLSMARHTLRQRKSAKRAWQRCRRRKAMIRGFLHYMKSG